MNHVPHLPQPFQCYKLEAVALKQWLLDNGCDDIFLDLDRVRGLKAGERWQEALWRAAVKRYIHYPAEEGGQGNIVEEIQKSFLDRFILDAHSVQA